MKEYLISTPMSLEATYPAFILAGDFNRTFLPMIQSAVKSFNLKPTVTFPTRGDRILDQIFMNLGNYFSDLIRLPPFGLSDHATDYIGSSARSALKPKHKIIKSRDKRTSKVNSVGRFLLEIPWWGLLSSDQSCEGKLSLLTEGINYGLDTIMPVRSITIHETDCPWVSTHLKQLIIHRQKAFSSGNQPLFKILKNKVNRECKRCRMVYYENKVKDLQDSKPRNWWREVNQLCGSAKTTGRDLTSILHPDLVCDESTLVDKINKAFVHVMEDYSPLTECVCVDGTGSTVRTALLDFRKAFDLVDHHILVAKLRRLGVKPSVVNWIIDFLRDRQQRVKVNGVFSDWLDVPAGVPQGTRLGPWLFLSMINDLHLPEGFHMWKFADDTTVSEVVPPSKHSTLQQVADFIHDWSQENHLQLNLIKCKEIRTCFHRTPPCFSQVAIEGVEFEIVSSAKVLGVVVRSDLKWSAHIDSITTKAAKRLYLLRQLKRAGIAHSDLERFYCSVIRSILEYACQVFHQFHNLPSYLSEEIERIQRRALRVIFPDCSYSEGLAKAGLTTLYDRRSTLCKELFSDIDTQGNRRLSH